MQPERPQRHTEEHDNPFHDSEVRFLHFLYDQGYTGAQLREAYYRLMGVSAAQESDPSSEALLKEMRDLEAEHFPINRFATMIETIDRIETAVPAYDRFVEDLPVSPNEKYLLHSLVARKRSGKLELSLGDMPRAEIVIPENTSEHNPAAIALQLLEVFEPIAKEAITTKQPISFLFEE